MEAFAIRIAAAGGDAVHLCMGVKQRGGLTALVVKLGGVAVHTTEFNVASNDATLDAGWSVIYRQRDIEEIGHRLRRIGCGPAACDFYAGDHEYDLNFDVRPFGGPEREHVKLLLDGHLTTSMMLVVRKGS